MTRRDATPAATPVLVERLRKSFGPVEALCGVDLQVEHGEIVALLGPNGAGKTTLLRILLGLRRPDAGEVKLFGSPPRDAAARTRCGWAPQETSFPATLRVRELIELVRAHYPKRSPTDAVLDRFGLQAVARRQVGGLSGGTRRRVAVALAFAGMPDLVVLDEPTTGLDVETRRLVWSEVRAHVRGGGTVLLTTHHLEEAEELATRIVVIAEGRVLASGTTAAIRAEAGLTRIRLAAHAGSILGVEGIVRRRDHCGRVTLYARDGGEVVRRLAEAGVPLTGLEVAAASLEEAFIALTRESP